MKYRTEYLAETTSTNDEARDDRFGHGDIVVAEAQTEGRGQRGNSWASESGKNLTFSVVLKPTFLPAANQFLLSEIVSLAITDMLSRYGIDAKIKWPNDIYADGRKIAGILIENDLKGSVMYRTIAGIGINVNQTVFDPALPNPTSMKLITGEDCDRIEVLDGFAEAFFKRYAALEKGYVNGIERDYHTRLYRVGEPASYLLPDCTSFTGVIMHVQQSGELVMQLADGTVRRFLFKEVEYTL